MKELAFNARGDLVTAEDRRFRIHGKPVGRPAMVSYGAMDGINSESARRYLGKELRECGRRNNLEADAFMLGDTSRIGITYTHTVQFYKIK